MLQRGGRSFEARRRELVARSGAQRAALVDALTPFAPALAVADKLALAAGWARRHGVLVIGVAAAVIAVRKPSRLLRYAGQAWTAWRLYHDYRDRFDGLIERIERR